nr:MAG TPA: hypothetical protein [Caudoviricetes sp.]
MALFYWVVLTLKLILEKKWLKSKKGGFNHLIIEKQKGV